MAQRKITAAAFHVQSTEERFVLQVPTAQREIGMPQRCGWSVTALRDCPQALLWAMFLEKWSRAVRSV